MIVVDSLTKIYDDLKLGPRVALGGLSFAAAEGEIFGLLGPNGAGKTTALRIISTLLKPTSGTASVNGFDCGTQPELVRHQIGVISANTAVYDRMTPWEIVEYFGRVHGLADQLLHERMRRVFHELRMDDIRDVMGGKLSTGMKQKVAIARALVHDPPVLIFDEATNGLDVLVARSLLDIVRRLRDAGKCILFSTHIMREVERLCDRVAVLHRGELLAQGSLADLQAAHGQSDLEDLFFLLIQQREADSTLAEVQP